MDIKIPTTSYQLVVNTSRYSIKCISRHIPSEFGHSFQGVCSCDERCRILGDCCVDAPRECFGAENDSGDNFLPGDDKSWVEFNRIRSMDIKRSLWMVSIGLYDRLLMDYRFINRCPERASYKHQCEFNLLLSTDSSM